MARWPLGRGNLVASYFTLAGAGVGEPARFSVVERIAAAAAAGFSGIGLTADDYESARASGLSDAELRTVLDHHGVDVVELEFLFDWARGGERGRLSRIVEDRLYAVADALGARHLNIGDIQPAGELEPLAVVAERFAGLCDRAARHGLLVALEFLPWSDIADAATAWEIARLAARPNGGILVDAYHYFRGGADADALRSIPAAGIIAVQLDDAAEAPPGAAPYEGTLDRRLPGEGVFDLVGRVRVLDAIGVTAPVSVEIISPEHHALPLEKAARRAHETTLAVLSGAR
jgi:sugar phosphate isomerase/epimerase